MPLRTRLRRALTGSASPTEGGPLSKIMASKTPNIPESDFYLPGEKMPPLKYRRPVDPEHKRRLESFTFKTAWRKRSHQSLYSPMGSRLPSRRGSFRSRRSRSRSIARSRRSSFSDYDAEEDWVDSGIGASIAGDDRPANIKEASDDEGDVLNVGLSRNPTEDPRDKRKPSNLNLFTETVQPSRPDTATATDRRNHSQPFTAEELELALQRSHLDVSCTPDSEIPPEAPCEHALDFADPSPFLRPRGGSIYVPYDGQGTPPELPFWGSAFAAADTAAIAPVPLHEQFACERRASIFVPSEDGAAPTSPLASGRRPSIFASNELSSPVTMAIASSEPARKKAPPPPCCPSDAIAAILSRRD